MGVTSRLVTATVLALALGACQALMPAAYAPYEPAPWVGSGYTETEVQPGLFLVRFIGNSSTTPDRSADFALLRGAEICLQRGKGFIHVGNLSTRYQQTGYIPAGTSTTVTPTGPDSPPVVTTVETSPQTDLYSPTSGIAVSCADTKEPGAWDAGFLANAVRTKYSIKPEAAAVAGN